jgi:hypothetical protein
VLTPSSLAPWSRNLNREHDWLGEIAALAAGPVPVTTLRVLDVIAWHAGRTLRFVVGRVVGNV